MINGSGKDGLPVRAKGYGFYPIFMAVEGKKFPARGDIPELYGIIAGAGNNGLSIGTKSHGEDKF